jgi:cellulose synthase/poly-beta-1,6-N-acetylglucosamine synthase-like glycosyltransferase
MEVVEGWNPGSLTEDLDLTVRLWLAGQGRIYHVTDAIVWQEGVTTFNGLIRQRQRWAEGMLRTYIDYAFELLRDKSLSRRLRFDGFYVLLCVFFPLLTLLGLLTQALSTVVPVPFGSLPHPFGAVMTYAILGSAAAWSATISWRRDRRIDVVPGFIYLYYLLHWVPAVLIALRNVLGDRRVEWAKTEHRGHATLANLPGGATPVGPLTVQPVGAGRDN